MSFTLLVGDNWYAYMYDTIRAYSEFCRLYFLIVVYFGNLTLINVFTAILINTFGEESEKIRKNLKKLQSAGTIDYEKFWHVKINKVRPVIRRFFEKNYGFFEALWANMKKIATNANSRLSQRKSVGFIKKTVNFASIFPVNKKPQFKDLQIITVSKPAVKINNYNKMAGILSAKPNVSEDKTRHSTFRKSILAGIYGLKFFNKDTNVRKPSELLYKNEIKNNIFLSIEQSYRNNIIDFEAFNEKVKNYRKDRQKNTKANNLSEEYNFMSKMRADLQIKLEGFSLGFMGVENKFRKICSKILNNPLFEGMILVVIVISCVLLAATNPLSDPSSQFNYFLFVFDVVLALIFLMEIIIKIVVHGMVFNGKNSYLRTNWHLFDFLISVFFILATFEAIQLKLTALKSFRFARILRPLRLISRNEGLKLIINSFLMALPTLFNLILLVFSFFYICSVFLVNNFKGAFHFCTINSSLISDKLSCFDYGGDWVNKDLNLDNVWMAMATLLAISTTDNWTETMFNMMDSVGIDKTPIEGYGKVWRYFSMIFISLSTFVVLNLFTSLVVDSYQREKDKGVGIASCSFQQKEWIKLQVRIFNMPPKLNVRSFIEGGLKIFYNRL